MTPGLVPVGRGFGRLRGFVSAWVSRALRSPSTTAEADVPATEAASGSAGTETDDTAEAACAACPHAPDSHDAIARRYCTATTAGGFNRHCVCVAGHDAPAQERSRPRT